MSEHPLQAIAAMQGQKQMKWTDVCNDFLKKIKAMKPKDRLEYVSCISELLFSIAKVVQGWNQWYGMEFNKPFSRKPLSEIPEEQFKQIFEFFKTTATNMLEFDIQVTEIAEKKDEEERKKKKKPKKSNNKKRTYVS